MKEVIVTVTNTVGLHARPAALFFQMARQFKSRITIQNVSRPNSKEMTVSAFNLLQLGVKQGHEIAIRADGEDEDAALEALTDLVASRFGEA